MGSKKSSGPSAPLLQFQHLSLTLPDGRKILDDVSCAVHRRRVGLVGKNGAGKTTLLKAIAGEPPVSATGSARVGFLAQSSAAPTGRSVEDVFGIASVRAALARLALGDDDPSLYDVIGDDWDAEARAERALAAVGLTPAFLVRTDASLSGGEWTRVRLAALLMEDPDVLLLDEPSNHLDRGGREALIAFMATWNKGLVIASHDRSLLEYVDETWELRDGKIFVYGGSFSFYRAQRDSEKEAARQAYEAARTEAKRATTQAQEARERQAKRTARGAKAAPKAGLPTIVLGMMKRRAEETSAKLSGTHERRVAEAEERVDDARAQLSDDTALTLDAHSVVLPKDKLVLTFEGLNVVLPGQTHPLWQEPLAAMVRGPARIALKGANGAGKSSLLKLIMAGDPRVRWGVAHKVACDQSLAFLQDDKTVIENFREWAPGMAESERRVRLGRSLFPGDAVAKRAGELSGGERMRLALACLLAGERAPEALLMDEPNNHLDLTSLEELERALAGYRGALIVVSHDEAFLEAIKITEVWTLSREGLKTD